MSCPGALAVGGPEYKQASLKEKALLIRYLYFSHKNLLPYADDLVLLGDNIGRLQYVLDKLSEFCDQWSLAVNMSKTNFMVFRNGGIIKRNEKVYYKGECIKPISYYNIWVS